LLAGLLNQRGEMLPLEGDGGTFGIVLVVGVGRYCGSDDVGEIALKGGVPGNRSRTLGPKHGALAIIARHAFLPITRAARWVPPCALAGLIRQAGAMAEIRTLMAVHAHPDDEASSTGGVLALYSDQGIRTVVVTCTNGEFGDAPGQVKPGEDGHDEQAVAQLRLAELRQSCKILGVSQLELLGYHDSGMPDWDYKDRPDAFCNVPIDVVAGRIGALIDSYRPQVVISYDDKGMYQHPDHVHASLAAAAAVAETGTPAKFYQTAMRGSSWRKVWEALRELGAPVPDQREFTAEQQQQMEAAEQRITTNIDIGAALERKREALYAHASQIQDSWFSRLPAEIARDTFGRESFVRVVDRTGAPVPEDDLFAGLR
jgi:LmbE family N-acetylglucosaminyl deacetylase